MKKIILDDEDRDQFLESLKNPPFPNQKLIDAFKLYEKTAVLLYVNHENQATD